ncbi:MAG TPA: polysaccharide deacetylase family protein [Candidatus Limnocylindrales bacterium]|nr:polysaccharide deacetylase family protein [Candidatus Limnocylindrales bacterium]
MGTSIDAGGRFRVALTFDAEHPDRPHRPGVTAGIIEVLAERHVPSTWFLQGRWVESAPELARQVVADGHLVGSHSFYHTRLPLLTDDGIATDLPDAERVIREVTGVDPRPWFRCPFSAGADDPRVLGILDGLGYRDIGADVILEDWEPSRTGANLTADALRDTPAFGDGAVVLFHAWPPGTLDALPLIVDGLRALGAAFVRIDELERFARPSGAGSAPAPRSREQPAP